MPDNGMTMKALLDFGTGALKEAGVPDAQIDAWLLLQHVTGVSRAHFYAHPEETVTEEASRKYREMIRRRAGRIPLQHITGTAWFMGEEYEVDQSVLIPRPDTETLCEAVIGFLKDRKDPVVLDLCTGSGCILISLLLFLPTAAGIGTDLSGAALKTAKKNAKRAGVTDRAEFRQGDLFEALKTAESVAGAEGVLRADNVPGADDAGMTLFDAVVSNPPYIPTAEIDTLMDEVRLHDPLMALDGGEDGLDFYRKITEEAEKHLKKGGALFLETGKGQGAAVSRMMQDRGFQKIKIINDLSGADRVVMGIHP